MTSLFGEAFVGSRQEYVELMPTDLRIGLLRSDSQLNLRV